MFDFHELFYPKRVGKRDRVILEYLLVIREAVGVIPRRKGIGLVKVSKDKVIL